MATYRRHELILQDALADVRAINEILALDEDQHQLGVCVVQQMLARLTMFADPEIQTRMLAAIGGPSSLAEAALIFGWSHREKLQ